MDGDITKDIRDASVLGKYLKSIGMRDTEAYAPRTLFLSVSNMRTGKKIGCPPKFKVFRDSGGSINIVVAGIIEVREGIYKLYTQLYMYRSDIYTIVYSKGAQTAYHDSVNPGEIKELKLKYAHTMKRLRSCNSYQEVLRLFDDIEEGRV